MNAAMAHFVLGVLVLSTSASAADTNPIGKVLEPLSNLESQINAEGAEAQKMHDEMTAWCHDREMNLGFDIKTVKSDVAGLSAAIDKQSSLISAGATKVEELSSGIAANEA